jgi:hypothetical protein
MNALTNVLVLAAVPRSGDQLPGVYREVQHIKQILAASRRPFKVQVHETAKLTDLRRGLMEFQPEIVHFAGHGNPDGLIFEDSEGGPYLVRGLEVAQAFQALAGVTKCAFLSADRTAAIAENIALSIDHVIAYRDSTYDEDAADFAETFYNHISAGESVISSFERARLRVELKGDDQTPPLLISRLAASPPQNAFRLALLEPDLVLALSRDPSLMQKLEWRSFERILAQILERLGYEIELQRGTKDGGVDIFAIMKQGVFGQERYLVQAKRWSKPVGVEPVREIIFLHSHHRMTKSCLASTSRFTRGAWSLASEYQWQLELRDAVKLREWIERATLAR